MLDPEYLQQISEGAEEIASELQTEILKRIVQRVRTRLARGDDYILTSLDKWQADVLQDSGMLLEDIQEAIAKATKLQKKEIKEAFEDAGIKSVEWDDSIYKAAGLHPKALLESPYLVRLMQRAYEATQGEWVNFTRTTANAAQKLFISECDKAYNLVSSGSIGYTQAYKEAINSIVRDGATVHYPSGHTDTIETATLRAVRTGISQACADITDARMEEMGWDIVLVSAHLGARVTEREDYTNHYWWQGQFYSKSGNDKRFKPFSVCGMGDVQGIHGANCRHSHGPGDGVNNPFEKYDSEENRKAYELSQRQRALERRIRKTKQEVMALKEAGDPLEEEYKKKAALLQKQNKAYNEFCEVNGLKRRQERLDVAKWDRKQAAQAASAAKKYHTDWLKSIGAEGTSLNTLDKYLSAEYNKTDEYGLLKGYNSAVEKGDISPLVTFDQYKVTAAAIDEHIVGEITSTGVQIEGYTTHFVDRVIGQAADAHPGKRTGVNVSDVLDAIVDTESRVVSKVMANGDARQVFYGKKAKVVISETDMIVIQTNPLGE